MNDKVNNTTVPLTKLVEDSSSRNPDIPISDICKKHPPEIPTLSKRAFKKIQKQKKWEESKITLKLKRKEAKKLRKLRRQELNAKGILPPSQPRDNPNSTPSGITLIIDCQFEDKMSDKVIYNNQFPSVSYFFYRATSGSTFIL
ncbi:hypothetical protein HMI54_001817 [Coelomomyces lativittatus]|nr:hypothetical protein HMI54_001817 [Coelomomyces lativittatus]